MLGMSFSEILVIALIAVLVLGPDKLPKAMVEIAKFLKFFKKSINDAKASFDQEIKIAELKADAQKYKDSLNDAKNKVRKKLTFEELEELKNGVKDISDEFNSAKNIVNENVANLSNLQENTTNLKSQDKKED
ncbi:sec-independent translocase [Campylobacter sputorum subsp. bubulus]|uniref:Sec-independent protein translocase protein TatB homolog n=1 Tax=Campylobacter sputorum subsp. sputorum TaxID=32024 RepID=A0A381DJ77_9BACT|nr:Sec-independent protein translocase protein TatB [Campylobacter sputorum]ASM35573.1 twin arginine translocation system, TatB family protein [Campylobacter sputorum aubsp. sputorum RM3237]KAB0582694.1 Sec-independent protein translocase subunit TatB [Campylobacter sputorum subsp. sputorum]QEL05764.1 twin arginine translocation system, TatB protein [Campylobacter sputorum subsp. sputorum]SUX08129.1 sec-independent translocase [Campylobacter sputorum subsp. bubulus]SUX10541.1 sec-independent t